MLTYYRGRMMPYQCLTLWANKADGLLVAIQCAIEATSPEGIDGGVFSGARWQLSQTEKAVRYQQQRWLEEAAKFKPSDEGEK